MTTAPPPLSPQTNLVKSASDDSQRWVDTKGGCLEAKDGKLTFGELTYDVDGFATVTQWKMSR